MIKNVLEILSLFDRLAQYFLDWLQPKVVRLEDRHPNFWELGH
jgi:hypothetical protein